MKVIPLHCLVFLIGGDRTIESKFDAHEIISYEGVKLSLVGKNNHSDIHEVVISDIQRIVQNKLKLGERVVISGELDRADRLSIGRCVQNAGCPIIYLVFENNRDAERGDNFAEVIDGRTGEICAVPSQRTIDFEYLREKYSGVSVVGDIHGMHQNLQNALSWIRSRNQFPIFLGDIIDYGPASLEVVDEIYRLVMRGEAKLILGNHERKIIKWSNGHSVRLSSGNKVTTHAITQLNDTQKSKWLGRFRALCQNSRLIETLNNVTFAHAGVHPDYWNSRELSKVVEQVALFGEVGQAPHTERPPLTYGWVDAIPHDHIVVVGHDCRSTSPLVQTNEQNGRAVFMDTGSGKGGSLSCADFRFEGETLRLENFIMV